MTTTVFNQTEQRIAAATDSAKVLQHERRERMRDEIGLEAYTSAKQALPMLEQFVNGRVHPWRQTIEALAQAGVKLSPPRQLGLSVFMWLRDMDHLQQIPLFLQRGVKAYENLEAPIWKVDGKSEDINQRVLLINDIRRDLNSHQGARDRMEGLIAQVEGWLKESGWPNGHAQESDQQATA